jgi:hypothetical protein
MADGYAYSVKQLADIWNVSARHVYSLCVTNQLGHLRLGKSIIRIREADKEAFEARQMARPKSDKPTYKLVQRGSRFYIRWWEAGAWQRVSTGTTDSREAKKFLAQFEAGRGTPAAPEAPTVNTIIDGYLADRQPVVRAYPTLVAAAKPLRRHLGDLEPDHLTKERIRFYMSRRRAEGHMVGPADARRKKPTQDGTIIRELVMLRSALKLAVQEKWISSAPHIETPHQPAPRDRWLTREEADRLIESAVAPHVRLFLQLALTRQLGLPLFWI